MSTSLHGRSSSGAAAVLTLVLAACGGGASSGAASTDTPQPFGEVLELSTDVLQTKGVAEWEITISELAEDTSTSSDGEGITVRFDAQALLTESEQVPVTTRESFGFNILGGATSVSYPWSGQGCGEEAFDEGLLLQTGEAAQGGVCISIAEEDLDHPDTLISVTFNLDEAVYFGDANASPPA